MKVVVFGLGYVGSVSAACLAAEVVDVVGIDSDAVKVDAINRGTSPIVEHGLDELVAAGRRSGRLRAVTDFISGLDSANVSMVCVGTPSRPNGSLDLTFVERVAEQIGLWLGTIDHHHVVVFRSTMLPGTVETVLTPILEAASGKRAGIDFSVAMCPEFLRESSAVRDFYDPPFTIAGCSDDTGRGVLRQLFGFLERPFLETDIAVAEAMKYACNAFHAVKISFANEVARFCESSGVDGRAVMDLVVQDDRLNISPAYLRPGFAFGGSCLPKDLRAVGHRARSMDLDLPLLFSVLPSNESHIREAVRVVLDTGADRVALLGLSFKSGTDDLRESPQVELAESLLGKGVDLTIFDSNVRPDHLRGANRRFVHERLPHLGRLLVDDPVEAMTRADCVVIATDEQAVHADVLCVSPSHVIDLTGSSAEVLGSLPGYHGLAW
jgi:GDP-mannose 6-dehydrogenase